MSAEVPAVITLTSDFGTRDTYVAEMKAVILGITRAVHLVDLTHEIAPRDVPGGAFALHRAAPRFPPRTIHLAVVDPGVGTPRRALVVAASDQLFVGPDNGLFTPFLDAPGWTAFELTAPEYRLPRVTSTFHGRDVFAPAAAHLALGVPAPAFGPPVHDPVRLAALRGQSGEAPRGQVLHVDRFGNLVTSITEEAVARLGTAVDVRIGGRRLPLVRTYGDLRRGTVGALIGSDGRLEVAVRDGSAARVLALRAGAPVALSPRRSATRSSRSPRTAMRTPGTARSPRTAPGRSS